MEKGYKSRKTKGRKESKTLLIVCEGQKTERIYFNHYRERNSGLIVNTLNSNVTDPINLVEFAIRQITKYGLDLDNGDQVWCVFDADRNTEENIKKAEELAANKVKLCLSNPCFELWYLLHFEFHNSKISTSDVQNTLKKRHIKDYDKTKDYFQTLLPNRENAIKHSKKLNQQHASASTKLLSIKSNPSTQVFQLVEYIRETIKKNAK